MRIIAAKAPPEEIEHGPAPEMLARIQTADLGPVATRYLRTASVTLTSGIKLRNADLTFDRDLAIEPAGRRVDLLNSGPAHITTADSVVHGRRRCAVCRGFVVHRLHRLCGRGPIATGWRPATR